MLCVDVFFRIQPFPDKTNADPVVKRSVTSLATRVSRVRIPSSSRKCACSSVVERRAARLKGLVASQVSPVPRFGCQFGGGEEYECIGKSAASQMRRSLVQIQPGLRGPVAQLPARETRVRMFPAIRGQPVVRMSATSWVKVGSNPAGRKSRRSPAGILARRLSSARNDDGVGSVGGCDGEDQQAQGHAHP